MARSRPGRAAETRGRVVQPRHRFRFLPLVGATLLLLALALGVVLWQDNREGTAAGAVRPIATLSTADVHALLWSATEANTVFVGHHGGLLRSDDGGRTWQPTTLKDADAMSLAVSSQAPTRIYAAGHGVFRRSDDGGKTWTAPDVPIQGADIHAFAQNPVNPDHLYALEASRGILVSTDAGATWKPVASTPGHAALGVTADGKTLLLGTSDGVQGSPDQGVTWQPFGQGLPRFTQVLGLAVDPGDNTVFAATSKGLFHRNGTDRDWQPTALTQPLISVAASPLQAGVVIAVDDAKRVYRSDDGGATWSGSGA